MAVTKRYTQSIPVQLEPEWRDRVQAACDTAGVSKAEIIRDCIKAVLPSIEVSLGIASDEVKQEVFRQVAETMGLEHFAEPDDDHDAGSPVLDLDELEEPEPKVKTAVQIHAELVEKAKAAGDRSAGSFGWTPEKSIAQGFLTDGPVG